ncbi:MAG TPA: hypothetical protein VGG89_12850 [Candidatus Baltobacteraceae bacterium]|jgi:hypothetical protein
MNVRCAGLLAFIVVSGCARNAGSPLPAAASAALSHRSTSNALLHAAVGFSVDTPVRAATAAGQGITSTILYGGSPSPGSALEKALESHDIGVIDGGISSILFYWECHRTHSVAPPPSSYSRNYYCQTDENTRISSDAAALAYVSRLLDRDVKRPYVIGYWVLDDWASWDPGSGRNLLRKIHALVAQKTPGRPAVCGFGAGFGKGTTYYWDPGTAANYSNTGCDVVGWYNYTPFGKHKPSSGVNYNWSMHGLLPAMSRSLEKYGWDISRTPLMGIGQAWGGRYNGNHYQPGITTNEIRTQAAAFCAFGASIISWYAWDDSGDNAQTLTPNDSPAVATGIKAGLSACRATWAR